MKSPDYSDDDWIERMFSKSNSERTRNSAYTSLKMFGYFCKSQGVSQNQLLEQYQIWAKQGDIRSIGLSLSKFVRFLNKDDPTLILNPLGKRR